jgi:hypothetical protein
MARSAPWSGFDMLDDQFGMIKPGSRTELVLPAEEGLEIRVHLGDNVIAGTSVLAAYAAGKG